MGNVDGGISLDFIRGVEVHHKLQDIQARPISSPKKEILSTYTEMIHGSGDFIRTNIVDRSQVFWEKIEESLDDFPELQEKFTKLETYRKDHKSQFEELKGTGWSELKRKPGKDMATDKGMPCSYETLRKETVSLIQDACLAVVKHMGYTTGSAPGSAHFSAVGTPGWDSDIDTSFEQPEGMNFQERTMVKHMFDLFVYANFGVPSGFLLDTECYLMHPGETLHTEDALPTEEGKAGYSHLEMTATSLQMLQQIGDPRSTEWGEYRSSCLKDISDPDVLKALNDTFDDVEKFYCKIQQDIANLVKADLDKKKIGIRAEIKDNPGKIQEEFPKEWMAAKLSYKMAILDNVAQSIDNPSLDPNLGNESSLSSVSPDVRITLKKAFAANVLTALSEEGYISHGAYDRIVMKEGGQKTQRETEKIREMSAQSTTGVIDLRGISHYGSEKPTASNNLSSVMDNLSMYTGHFRSHYSPERPADTLITVSKYAERVVASAMALTDQIQEKLSASETKNKDMKDQLSAQKLELDGLREILGEFSTEAGNLERVKRQKRLPDSTTAEFLEKAILKEPPALEEAYVKSAIDESVNEIRKIISASPERPPQDLYNKFVSILIKRDIIKPFDAIDDDGVAPCPNPEVTNSIKAFCGLGIDKGVTAESIEKAILKKPPVLKKDDVKSAIEASIKEIRKIISDSPERSPQDLYNKFVSTLVDTGIIELVDAKDMDGVAPCPDPKVTNIIKAFCGLGIENKEIKDVLVEGKKLFQEKYSDPDKVKHFNEYLRNIAFNIQTLAFKTGAVTPPAIWSTIENGMSKIWDEARR